MKREETGESYVSTHDRIMAARTGAQRRRRRDSAWRWMILGATLCNSLAILDIKTGFLPW